MWIAGFASLLSSTAAVEVTCYRIAQETADELRTAWYSVDGQTEVITGGRHSHASTWWACEYPDGTRFLGAETPELRDGKVVRQVNVEAWDE